MANQKNYRKFAVSTLAATAAVAAVAPAVSADSVEFTDVEKGDSHYEGIMALAEQGIVSGYADGSFGVNDNVTRQQVAVMLYEALELEAPTDVDSVLADYDDVDGDSIYAEQIAAVTAAGAFIGNNGKFNPGNEISRDQMASVLVSGLGLKDYDNGDDVDANLDNVNASHEDNVQVVANLDLTVELDDFRPDEEITRGQFATMLNGALNVEVATPAVESVSAINPTTIEVSFNKSVDADTVVPANFAINNDALTDATAPYTTSNSSVSLSEDGKTATISLNNAVKLDVGTAYSVKIDGLKAVEGTELATATELLVFSDDTAASITSVDALAGPSGKTSTVEVVFSENIDGATTLSQFRVNNVTPTNVVITDNVATLTLSSDIEVNQTHEVRVVDVADLSGNLTNVSEQFWVASDVVGPVASVEAKGETTVLVSFDEAVQAVAGSNVKITEGNVIVTGTVGTLSADKKSVEVSVNSLVYGTDETSADLNVEVSGVLDTQGNAMTTSNHSVTVAKDVVAPTVTGIEGDEATNTFVISFSEELAGTAGDSVTVPTLFQDNLKLGVTNSVLKADDNGDVTQVEVTTSAALEGSYVVTVAADSVTDTSLAANTNAQTTQSFAATAPESPSDEVAPGVNSVTVSGDVATVVYDDVDLTNSAVNYSNYKIDGQVIPSDSLLYFDGTKATVKIELPTGYFNSDKNDVIFDITNIVDTSNNVLDRHTENNVVVEDTQAASIESAKVTGTNTLVLAFDEDISTGSSLDFTNLTIEDSAGNVFAPGATSSETVSGNEVTISLANALDLSKSYTVSATAGNGLVDQAGIDNDATGNEVTPFADVAITDAIAPTLSGSDFFDNTIYSSDTIGVTADAIATTDFAVADADLSEEVSSVKLVYSDADGTTNDVVVAGTIELNATQDAYTYSFGSVDLSSQVAGTLDVSLVLVDAEGNESTGYNVVTDASGTTYNSLSLVK